MERSALPVSVQDKQDRLAELLPRVAPVAFAKERMLPIVDALEPLLGEGLVRGSILGCRGGAAVSVALASAAGASAAGSWLAVAGLPSLGLRAASEVGIALERLVMIADPSMREAQLTESAWVNMMSAMIDGFDLIVVRSPVVSNAATVRRLQTRLHVRGAVLVVVGDPGPFSCDVVIAGQSGGWEGLGHGSGRLLRRRLTLTASGRRLPRERRVDVWLPGATGGIEIAEPLSPSEIDIGARRAG